ncbi:MAG: hypothetical protein ACRD9L_14465, partial [Bryobacteraceae bacterium]
MKPDLLYLYYFPSPLGLGRPRRLLAGIFLLVTAVFSQTALDPPSNIWQIGRSNAALDPAGNIWRI